MPQITCSSSTKTKTEPEDQHRPEMAELAERDAVAARLRPKRSAEVTEEIDAFLDEIDSVLEENAETFVQNFRQRGGQ